jgi:hypothetical protein
MNKKKIKKIKSIDPKYIGVPNICFSLTDKNDSREKSLSKQRIERGFDDSEMWSLDETIANFILPRLKRFREIYPQSIVDSESFIKEVDKMIVAFEIVKKCGPYNDEEQTKLKDGFKSFGEYIQGLWT